jgi:hypothetical protein
VAIVALDGLKHAAKLLHERFWEQTVGGDNGLIASQRLGGSDGLNTPFNSFRVAHWRELHRLLHQRRQVQQPPRYAKTRTDRDVRNRRDSAVLRRMKIGDWSNFARVASHSIAAHDDAVVIPGGHIAWVPYVGCVWEDLTMFRFARTSALCAAVGMSLIFHSAEAGPLVNGGFETGDLSGWNLGLLSGLARGGAGVLNSPSGEHSAMISNGGLISDASGFIGPVNSGLPLDVVNGAGAGSATPCDFTNCGIEFFHAAAQLSQSFSVAGPGVLTFSWIFQSNEETLFDFGFVTLIGDSLVHTETLARGGGGSGTLLDPVAQSQGQYSFTTGAGVHVVPLPNAGVYTIVFGSASTEDELITSALLVDDVQVEEFRTVAEPSSLPLLCLGLLAFVLSRRHMMV